MYIFICLSIDFIYDIIIMMFNKWVKVSDDINGIEYIILVSFMVYSNVINIFIV